MMRRLLLIAMLAWPVSASAATEPCSAAREMCGPRPEAVVVCHEGRVADILPAAATVVLLPVGATCATDDGVLIGPQSAVAKWWSRHGLEPVMLVRRLTVPILVRMHLNAQR